MQKKSQEQFQSNVSRSNKNLSKNDNEGEKMWQSIQAQNPKNKAPKIISEKSEKIKLTVKMFSRQTGSPLYQTDCFSSTRCATRTKKRPPDCLDSGVNKRTVFGLADFGPYG